MLRVLRSLLTGLPLIALPAVAAETAVATGITSVGPAVFMFTIGGALFLIYLLPWSFFVGAALRLAGPAEEHQGMRWYPVRLPPLTLIFTSPTGHSGPASSCFRTAASGGNAANAPDAQAVYETTFDAY